VTHIQKAKHAKYTSPEAVAELQDSLSKVVDDELKLLWIKSLAVRQQLPDWCTWHASPSEYGSHFLLPTKEIDINYTIQH
jgi:hypothetical protein